VCSPPRAAPTARPAGLTGPAGTAGTALLLPVAETVAERLLAVPALPERRPVTPGEWAQPAVRSVMPQALLASRDDSAALPAVPSPDAAAVEQQSVAALAAGSARVAELHAAAPPAGVAQARTQARLPLATRRRRQS